MHLTFPDHEKPARASATARLIAAATVMADASGDASIAPPVGAARWSARFLSGCRADRWLLGSVRSSIARFVWRRIESLAAAGVVRHWMHRKRTIDRLVRQAAKEGFTNLIVLGSGLDSLGFRCASDGIFTQVALADRAESLGVLQQTCRQDIERQAIHLLPIELARDDFASNFRQAVQYQPHGPTVVVVEGVLMYLEPDVVRRTLAAIAGLPVPRVRLIASWMHNRPCQRIGFDRQSRWVFPWLGRQRETMHWASSAAAIGPLLKEMGWSSAAPVDLAATNPHRRAGDVAGEWLVTADRNPPAWG